MENDNKTSRDQPEPGRLPLEDENLPPAWKTLPARLAKSLRRAVRRVSRLRAKIVRNASEIYFEACDALSEIRKNIRHEHLLRRFTRSHRHRTRSQKAPDTRESGAPPLPGIPHSEVASAFAKGLATLETAKSPGIRPIQNKEVASRFRNVLVVGGMDFFGAALVHELNAVGFREITITDSLSDGVCSGLPTLKFREFLSHDEVKESSRFRQWTDFSHVFFLDRWAEDSIGFPKLLLAAIFKSGGRFIALSPAASMGAIGPAEARHHPENFRPRTPGGVLSCLFDRYAVSKSPDKNYISLKHHQLFGPGEQPGSGLGGLVKSCHSQIRSTGSVRLPPALGPDAPEGRRKFDFFSILDAARVALYLSQSHIAEGIYELGSGASATPGDLARAVLAATGSEGKIVWDNTLGYEPPPPQPEQAFLGRLLEAGWNPSPTDLNAAVRDYTSTYLDHEIQLGEEPPKPASAPEESRSEPRTSLPPKRKKHAEPPDA
ncbi:MAG: NAD-dependent epimerase/dehydratase family protein [Verrucomicrobiae bacterium]